MLYMLDTDICIYLMSDRLPELNRRVAEMNERLAVSSITAGELHFGVEKSTRQAHNRRELDVFLALVDVKVFDADAARHYGQIRAQLERTGMPCGANDMLIGAHARSLGMTLVTNNRREFDRMPGLAVENWVA